MKTNGQSLENLTNKPTCFVPLAAGPPRDLSAAPGEPGHAADEAFTLKANVPYVIGEAMKR